MGGYGGARLPEQKNCGSETPDEAAKGFNKEEARLAPLVTMGTSPVSWGRFLQDKSGGRKEGQRDSIMEIYPSHAEGKYGNTNRERGIRNTARKLLR